MASQTTATTGAAAAVWKVQMLTFGVFDLAAILIKHIEIHTEANSSDFTHLSRDLYSVGYGKINCVNIQFVKLWYSRCFRFARFPFTTVGIQAKREHIDSGLQSLFGFEKTRQRLFYLWFTYDSTSKNVGKFTVFKNHQKSPNFKIFAIYYFSCENSNYTILVYLKHCQKSLILPIELLI